MDGAERAMPCVESFPLEGIVQTSTAQPLPSRRTGHFEALLMTQTEST
jgi:hypothetical protein